MAKNIHVIKDETLGGIEREYIEVDRKAEVGDLVTYVYKGERDGVISTVAKVNSVGGVELENPYKEINDDGDLSEIFGFSADAYRALEPTDIVHIDGERYRMVERKAEVGEKIIVVEEEPSDGDYSNGDILIVDESLEESAWEYEGVRVVNPHHSFLFTKEYRVLVPVEPELTAAEPPESLHDIIANLVRRVAQLESELTGAKRDIETWAQEVETLRYTNTELYSRLGHVEQDTDDLDEKVEMCIDDIVTLDERTNLSQEITINVAEFVKLIGGARR